MQKTEDNIAGEFYKMWVALYRKMEKNSEYARRIKEKYGTEILVTGKDNKGRDHFIVIMPKEFPWPDGHPRAKK